MHPAQQTDSFSIQIDLIVNSRSLFFKLVKKETRGRG